MDGWWTSGGGPALGRKGREKQLGRTGTNPWDRTRANWGGKRKDDVGGCFRPDCRLSWKPSWEGSVAACPCLSVFTASYRKGNPLRVSEQGCAMIRDSELKHFPSLSIRWWPWRSPTSPLSPVPVTQWEKWAPACSRPWVWQSSLAWSLSPRLPVPICQLPPLFFPSPLLSFHRHYYFGDHDFRSSQGHTLSQIPVVLTHWQQKSLGDDGGGGQEEGVAKGWWICRLWWWFHVVRTCQNLLHCTS